jgi:hypothetical protein
MILMKRYGKGFRSLLKLTFLSKFSFLFGWLFLTNFTSADAYECSGVSQLAPPKWVVDYGSNDNQSIVYGYAALKPQRNQTLDQINQLLKANSIGDLALNIRASVESAISSEQTFINDKATEKTKIVSKTKSDLSLSNLSGTLIFIDQLNCIAFARTGLAKADLPFIFALSDFRNFQKILNEGTASLQDIKGFDKTLALLETAGASSSSKNNFLAMAQEISRTSVKAKIAEIKIRVRTASQIDLEPQRKKSEATKVLELIKELEVTEIDEAQYSNEKDLAKDILNQIDAVLGKELIAVAWSVENETLAAGLNQYFSEASEQYWLPDRINTAENLGEITAKYNLDTALFLTIQTNKSRKFGIDEVDIEVGIEYISPSNKTENKSQKIETRAIGRPVLDEDIAKKIRLALERAL